MPPTLLKIFLLYICGMTMAVLSTTVNENTINSLPEVMRLSPSPLIHIINSSSATALQEEAIANFSNSVSNTSLSDIERDNLTQSLQQRYRERKKQERIIIIQANILHRLRMDRQPNITSSHLSEDQQKKLAIIVEHMNNNSQMDEMPSSPDNMYTMQRLQSFYPSCSLPNNTDRSSWENPTAFRIYYDIPFNRHSSTSLINIMLAKLRLYKITGNTDPNFVAWNPNESTLPRHDLLERLVNSRAANGINVSIYRYLKPLRANRREKKRLVDSRTISVDDEGWVEFNVMEPLNHWLHHSNKNFGFDVEVQDAYGNKLNPNLYFQNLNCSSGTPQEPPFPNIVELHPEMGENESSLFDNETYPTLDLQTAEIPLDFPEFDVPASRLNERVIRKRSNRNDVQNMCQKEEIYVSFAELGLDEYILWPQGVLWTFCNGGCRGVQIPRQRHVASKMDSNSKWIANLLRTKIDDSTSSCAVTSKESLPVILYDGEHQVYETVLEDLVPTSCGCSDS
ncbi:transforming growth factor beta-2 proprotein-like isoform X2 [Stegodyphus dumicola]|uniref:transforming growth factor beta-2 proprotein-like isoform X2 n=1 Tax=Stegodyphus dumicola TaxID=202533 RepID=UPI0015A95838|nr:transforming growth factor beta-2 proprotein-like isoform X2 [Stegodyphus dumicola]